MNCEELRDHYDFYALDIAEEPERSEIRAHLNRGCEVCMAGVKQSLETAALIGASAPPAQPSSTLRRRILASVGSEDRRTSWLLVWGAGLALAALLAVAVYFANSSRGYAQEAASLREEMRSETLQLTRLTEAFAILSGPRTTEVSFGGAQPRPPQGKVFVNATRGVLLIASNLPRTSADKIYEMWLIPKGAKPIPAGLFQSQDDGSAMHIRPGALDLASTAAVAVTVENQAGADQPTTTPLIVAALGGATPN
ncbi:MAG TPA: anti-sigma factor [Bryobacteraceae bacterium]|nr:anti-sigma factor [Bryobacteraceae bacterium]